MQRVVAGGPLVVLPRGARIDVLSNVCSHLSGPLDEGDLRGATDDSATDGEVEVLLPNAGRLGGGAR